MRCKISYPLLAGGLRASTLALRFVLMFFLAKFAPLEVVGLFGLYWAGLQLATTLLPLDVYAQSSRLILNKDMMRHEIISKHLGFVIIAIFFLGPLSAIAFALSSKNVSIFLAFFFFAHLVFEIISSESGRLLVPLGKPLAANFVLFIRSAIWVLPLIISLALGFILPKLENVIIFWLVGSVVSSIFSIGFLFKGFGGAIVPRIDLSWCYNIVCLSAFFLLSTLVFRSMLGADRFIVEHAFGVEAVAIYAFFASVSLGVLGLIESGVSAWHFPRLVKSIQDRNYALIKYELKVFVVKNTIASFFLMLLITLFFVFVTNRFLDDIYAENISMFYIISLSVFSYCISMPFHYVIYGFDKDYFLFGIYLISLLLMLIWAYFFMSGFGLMGAGMMLAVALGMIALLRFVVSVFLLSKRKPNFE